MMLRFKSHEKKTQVTDKASEQQEKDKKENKTLVNPEEYQDRK